MKRETLATMATYPVGIALERADILGWERDVTLMPQRPEGVSVVIHHRTGVRGEVCCRHIDDRNRWSDHWWLDTGEERITLVGTPTNVLG